MALHYYKSPIGILQLTGSHEGLKEVRFVEDMKTGKKKVPPELMAVTAQLDEYFAGTRKVFDLNLTPDGTPFQLKVWAELGKIPYGRKASYLDIATRLGDPAATRAVGASNGRNPIAIIVPCHRVIGSNGQLTGYAGGMKRKQWLLEFESRETTPLLF